MSKVHNRTQEERDDQFIEEHLKNAERYRYSWPTDLQWRNFLEDNDRCIKILEERKGK